MLGPVLLIVIGVLFLLNNLDLLRLRELVRYWPVFLIALGAWMLYLRITSAKDMSLGPEATNERH